MQALGDMEMLANVPALGQTHAHVRCPPSLALAGSPESWQAVALALERLGKWGLLGTERPLGRGLLFLAQQPHSWDATRWSPQPRRGELWHCAVVDFIDCDSPAEGALGKL